MGESLGGWLAARYTLQALSGDAAGASFVLPKPDRLVLCTAAGFRELMASRFEKAAADTAKPASRVGAGASLSGQKALISRIFKSPSYQSDEAIRNGFGFSLSKGDSYTIASVYGSPTLLNEAVDGQLGEISIPTLVLWGESDTIVPVAMGARYAR